MTFTGPKTRMISKAPWEEDTIHEEALSDTETQTDTLSIFAGKLKAKGRSRSKTLTQGKAEKERRFLGGGWGRTSSDTRPSMDSYNYKKSMDSSSFSQAPISPRTDTFSDQARSSARTPSVFSTSSGASSGPSGAQSLFSGGRPSMAAKFSGGLAINAFGMDSRTTSPAPSVSPTASNFVHPYANLELLQPVHEGGPSRSDSNATLTASTGASPYITPSSSSSSSATSPGQDEKFLASKKEKRRPPQISVSPLNQTNGLASAAKSPSALSTSHFVPMSPSAPKTPAGDDSGLPASMLGFPGSPAYNLISLEQAQVKARERSKTTVDNPNPTPPRRKELLTKKSKTSLVAVGGGFSSTIGVGSPSPLWTTEDGRARTVSAGSALHGRQKGHTIMSALAAQSTTSVNIIQGGGIENIPESVTGRSSVFTSSTTESVNSSGVASVTSADQAPARTLKPKRSGFLKFFMDKTSLNSNSGNPNISAPSAPVHVAHNTIDPPPVPKLPAHFQGVKASNPTDLDLPRERSLPPVVVSSPSRPRSFDRGRSFSDDSHTSIGDHNGGRIARDKYLRSNTEPAPRPENLSAQVPSDFNGLRLRPVSSAFNGLPEDYLHSSPKVGSASRGSSETADSSFGIEGPDVQSPVTPSFPVSARSTYTHVSTASSGSDVFSSSVDPRTPSSFGSFPHGVPRTSTESQSSAAIIAALREQLRCVTKASKIQVSELKSQVEELKLQLEEAKCDRCGHSGKERKSDEGGIVNRPRARTGGGTRTTFGAYNDLDR